MYVEVTFKVHFVEPFGLEDEMVLKFYMQDPILKIMAASNIGQKGYQKFHHPYSIPFLSVLHLNKALHNVHKRGSIQFQMHKRSRLGLDMTSILPEPLTDVEYSKIKSKGTYKVANSNISDKTFKYLRVTPSLMVFRKNHTM